MQYKETLYQIWHRNLSKFNHYLDQKLEQFGFKKLPAIYLTQNTEVFTETER